MSKTYSELALFLMWTLLLSFEVFSQALPCAVEPKAILAYSLASSNSICLVWPANYDRNGLQVARRVYTNRPSQWQAWNAIYANTNNPATAAEASQYCDTNVSSGIQYEYQIITSITNWVCSGTTNSTSWYYEYISTGTEVPLKDQRGKLVLLVESSLATPLTNELAALTDDLRGDGYQVYRHDVPASQVFDAGWKTNVANTKALIRADYNTDTNADWAIFIVGHVPIPYSGLDSPGSHTPNFGAHPADWYYADMNESAWTDTTANDTTATETNCWNVPGDGKFDQSYLPDAPELRIGRVDLVNMPAFGKSEVELVRQYLDRDHAWRNKQFTVRDRALIITAGIPYEMHSVYSSVSGSATNVDLGLWLTDATNSTSSYLFASSKGSGEHDGDDQIGRTTSFAATQFYAVFTTMYGSYYGDWDGGTHSNNFLWAAICTPGYTVSSYYHENVVNIDSSAMDEPIGYELYAIAATSFMKVATRYTSWAQVHPELGGAVYTINEQLKAYTTLMGDPTLRLRVVAPPTNVTVGMDSADNVLSWTLAADTNIQGYHVYRAPVTNVNAFARITSTPVTTGSFRDVNAAVGAYRYMVRTVKLEQSASRSFYNASEGIFATPLPRLTATLGPGNAPTLLISGEPGVQYTVQYATNLSDGTAWYPLTNITLSGLTGTVGLANTNPVIFYRLRN